MSKGRILIAEKDRDMAKMLQIYFDAQGYEVLAAGEVISQQFDKQLGRMAKLMCQQVNL